MFDLINDPLGVFMLIEFVVTTERSDVGCSLLPSFALSFSIQKIRYWIYV
uniref:Uncharacterized protein n=1 Tax=Arundo donax TaxID=35708 RepID=A0A0A9FP78_ARUDO